LTSESTTRGRRALATRLEILRGAAAAFRARGFHATRLDDVAAALRRTKGSLYYYFRSKEEILYFCQDHVLDALLAAARAAESEGGDAAEALERLLAAHVECLLGATGGGPAHFELEALPPALREKIVAKRDRYEAIVRKLIGRGQRAGRFGAGDAALLARLVLGSVNATARWYRPGGALTPAAIGHEVARRVVHGL
jgi:AcrR family transcriptional regulator